jgi:hypothetical protein
VVRDALIRLGGQGHLGQINEIVNGNPKCRTNPTWRDTIRRVVRQYKIFEPVPPDKSGVYRLVDEQPPSLNPQALRGDQSTKHGIVQGMLAGIGRTYGYETFVPRTDQTIRVFQGEPLSKHVTVNDCTAVFTSQNLAKIRQIDVIWFDEDDDGLFPAYAFEVEETTGVKSGLDRLLKIPRRLHAEYFVIGPSEREEELFKRYCEQTPYRSHRSHFSFRFYSDVEALFDAAAKHSAVRDDFGLVERWRRVAEDA